MAKTRRPLRVVAQGAAPALAPNKRRLLLVSPPVLYGQRWWGNRIANKPHLASLAGAVRDLAALQTIELDIIAGEPLEPLLAQVDAAFAAGPIALVGISCCAESGVRVSYARAAIWLRPAATRDENGARSLP